MRILTRYVLVELAKVFLVSLTALTVMMVVVGMAREALMQNLPLGQVLQLIPYILPDALRIALPATLLLAATSVYGRMSGSNEVVAAKSLGISPTTLLWPALLAAFLLSLVTVWMNDLAVSWGRNGAQRVLVEAVEEIAYSMLKAQRRYSSPRLSVNVRQVVGRKLIGPTVTIPARGKAPGLTIRAEEAELHSDQDSQVLKIVLRNGTFEANGVVTFHFGDEYEQEIPLRDASRAKNVSALPSWTALRLIPGQKREQTKIIERHQSDMAAEAAYQMFCGDFKGLTSREWETRVSVDQSHRERLSRLSLEPHRRWSAGFSCLCFVWVGAPMAILRRRSEAITSFFLCFLPVLIVYYPLLMYGIDGAKNGTIPPEAVWAGNALLSVWGAWLLRKVIRY